VSIISPISELELREGSILIGRLPECDLMIDGGLVSRMHARLSVRDDSVVLEDLHSTNGIYVNGTRITHSVLLREGDRLLIGTTEISLFEARPNARVAPLRPRRDEPQAAVSDAPILPPPSLRATLPTTLPVRPRESFGKLELHLDELAVELPADNGPPSARGTDLRSLRNRSSSVPSTARADALEVIGALAERLASSGNVEEARRVLSSHLKRILQGATAGLTVPDDVCRMASKHALSLARWSGQSAWIDYVVELHVAARRTMHPETFASFESVVLSLGDMDRQLFVYYVDGLRGERGLMSAEDGQVLDRLIKLAES
jgi:predicted component of type VI protein secretion system